MQNEVTAAIRFENIDQLRDLDANDQMNLNFYVELEPDRADERLTLAKRKSQNKEETDLIQAVRFNVTVKKITKITPLILAAALGRNQALKFILTNPTLDLSIVE